MSAIENFMANLLSTVDITGSVNWKVVLAMFLLGMLSEAYIQIPLLIESVWLAVGYQSTASGTAVLNTALIFIGISAGRQIALNILYRAVGAANTRLSRFYTSRMQKNRYYLKYMENEESFQRRFLSVPSVTLGMMTWLNGPIKFVLIVRRKLRVLLLGALFSGMAFDAIYLVMGAVFHGTSLQLTYLPFLLLIGFIILLVVRLKVSK